MVSYEDFLAQSGLTQKKLQQISTNTKDLINFEKPYPVEIKKSSIEGQGIFATEFIESGQIVCSARIKNMRTTGGRYINHSGNPNVFLKQQDENLYFVALAEIEIGSEFTVDYLENLKLIRRVSMNEENLIQLGTDSEMLLSNEAFTKVIDFLMNSSVQNWAQTEAQESVKREQFYAHLKALTDIVETLKHQVSVRDQINEKNSEKIIIEEE